MYRRALAISLYFHNSCIKIQHRCEISLKYAVKPHCLLSAIFLVAIMILWIGLAVLCLLLHFAPNIIFILIYNAFRITFLLLKELCLSIYHLCEFIAAHPTTHKIPGFMLRSFQILCGVLWVNIDLPNYIEDWISARDNIDDSIDNPNTPRVVSSEDNSTSTLSVASSSIRSCAGHTANRSPCKRQKMMPNDEAEQWYCWAHENKQ